MLRRMLTAALVAFAACSRAARLVTPRTGQVELRLARGTGD
jgi:hypothetical protein